MRKISEPPHIFLMHAAISYCFIQIVDMKSRNAKYMYGFVQKFLPLDSKLILKITTLFEGKKPKSSISSCLFVLANIP